jgi:hypothetical protein
MKEKVQFHLHFCLKKVRLCYTNVKTTNISVYTILKCISLYFITCFGVYFGHYQVTTTLQIHLACYLFTNHVGYFIKKLFTSLDKKHIYVALVKYNGYVAF